MKLVELNRKMNIYTWIVGLILVLIISGIFLRSYIKRDDVYYVRYDEESNLYYQVVLKENNYFKENYLEMDKQYIASLIDYISADFKYDLNVKEDLEYTYKYKIVANVNVIDNTTNKALYSYQENILEDTTGKSKNILKINEKVNIDYKKYNDSISEFVNVYNLKDVTSKLSINMYVGVAGTEKDFEKENDSVITLDIPLTTNTVAIDVDYNLSNNVDSLITLKSSYQNSKILLGVSIALVILDVGLLILLLKYIKDSETEEDKYKNQLKKILNNYGTYISKIEDEFDMKDYQILKVASFIDLLEIRDTIHIPIIMIENKENLMSYFIIPTTNNILYFYSLGVTQYALPSSNQEKMRDMDEQEV